MGRRPTCKHCGRKVKTTSRARLCSACQVRKVKKSVRDLKARKGKYYKKWRRAVKEALAKMPY